MAARPWGPPSRPQPPWKAHDRPGRDEGYAPMPAKPMPSSPPEQLAAIKTDDSVNVLLKRLETIGGASALLDAISGFDVALLPDWLAVLRLAHHAESDLEAWRELATAAPSLGGPRGILNLVKSAQVASVSNGPKTAPPSSPPSVWLSQAPAVTADSTATADVEVEVELEVDDYEELEQQTVEEKLEEAEAPRPQPPSSSPPKAAPTAPPPSAPVAQASWASVLKRPSPPQSKGWGKGIAPTVQAEQAHQAPTTSLRNVRPAPTTSPPQVVPIPSQDVVADSADVASVNEVPEVSVPLQDIPVASSTAAADSPPIEEVQVETQTTPIDVETPAQLEVEAEPHSSSSSSARHPQVETTQHSGQPQVRLEGAKLAEWLRRRIFQLRVHIGHAELLEVLQALDDEKLQSPFDEVKLWLGMDEVESMPAALVQLITEFKDVRCKPFARGST